MIRVNKRYLWLVEAVATHDSDECLLWPFRRDRDGYGRLRPPTEEYGRTTVAAHRLAFKIKHGRWPEPCGLHKCDVPACVNPSHIWEGTPIDNNQDRHIKGRSLRGSQQYSSKLTEAMVKEIRSIYKPRVLGFHRLAKRYGVSKHAIRLAVMKKSWRHVQ